MSGTGSSKVALVTGAGSGIGKAVAIRLLNNGYRVVLAGRRPEKLHASIAEVPQELRSRSSCVAADVTIEDSVASLLTEVQTQFGRLDLLFNNAGINMPSCSIEDVELADWERVVATNLTGMFLCAKHAVKLMKKQDPGGGRLINNGSISAHAPRPGSVAYTATKHAVTGLTKSINLDCRRHRIACGQIDIGNAQTDMVARMSSGVPQADGSIRPEPTMSLDAVTNAVLYMDSLPLEANVPFLTVMATEMPYIGRG